MKPVSRRASIPESKSASFFSDPYHPTLAEKDPLTPGSSALPSPSMLEAGGSRADRWLRPRRLGFRRIVWVTVLLGTAMLVWNHDRDFSFRRDKDASHVEVAPEVLAEEPPPPPYGFPQRPRMTPQGYSPFYGGSSKRPIDISSDPLPMTATLRERLDIWRAAPGGRGEIEGEVEPGGFMQWNLEQCNTITEQHNKHMIEHSANVWASANRSSIHKQREELIQHMEGLIGSPALTVEGEGRGIVMVAGNADTLKRAKWSVQMLRSYNSTLPVQVYHFPDERPPVDDPIRAELAELDVELVEAKGQFRDTKKSKNYHLKAIAVIDCPWREVLYLDSDSIPVRDPEYMFDAPGYKRLGFYATPDYWKASPNHGVWAIAGVKCRNEWEFETGQMFIDKRHHLDTFHLITYMLERHEQWFYYSDGDKDIFRWALLMLRKRWAVPGRWVAPGSLPSGTMSGKFCGLSMIQHDAWGEPLFVHYNLLKQVPSGVGQFNSWGKQKQFPLFNTWPAQPETARLGEPLNRPNDDKRRGLGDIDCDMLVDADEFGVARAPATEMVMRRSIRERGAHVFYHGGVTSALCIDVDYKDIRPEARKAEDEAYREAYKLALNETEALNQTIPATPVYPDWESPFQVVEWKTLPHLSTFEQTLYGFGFVPNGKGF